MISKAIKQEDKEKFDNRVTTSPVPQSTCVCPKAEAGRHCTNKSSQPQWYTILFKDNIKEHESQDCVQTMWCGGNWPNQNHRTTYRTNSRLQQANGKGFKEMRQCLILALKSFKMSKGDRDVSVVKNIGCCSCRGCRFYFQHPLGASQPSINLVPGDLTLFWPPWALSGHMVQKRTCRQNTNAHKIKIVN